MLRRCVELLLRCLRALVHYLNQSYKQWTKSGTVSLVTGTVVDVTRSKRELMAENMFLRQQLIVLEWQVSRPKPKPRDRQMLVMMASRIRGWEQTRVLSR